MANERWNQPGPGVAWGVDFSADGEILVVAYGDGTIRWLRWSDGEELLALFVEPQTRKWVAWTPTGYYMASAGGEDLIGWHVNRGWDQEADFFPASQFRADTIGPTSCASSCRRATRPRRFATPTPCLSSQSRRNRSPPLYRRSWQSLSPADGSHFSGDSIEIAYLLRSPSGLAIDRLDVLADGQPVAATGFEKTNAHEAQGHVAASLAEERHDCISHRPFRRSDQCAGQRGA